MHPKVTPKHLHRVHQSNVNQQLLHYSSRAQAANQSEDVLLMTAAAAQTPNTDDELPSTQPVPNHPATTIHQTTDSGNSDWIDPVRGKCYDFLSTKTAIIHIYYNFTLFFDDLCFKYS